MARPPRIEFAGACYHVINRGNYRRRIFAGVGAAAAFLRTLDEAAVRFGWEVHAYVVMSNHFHLALRLTEPNLSEGMKWLQGTWVRRFNTYRQWTGRPFQGRYKALLIEPGEALGRVCHYLHLNPVRAGIVPVAEASDYPFSSLHVFAQPDARPGWLSPHATLEAVGGLDDTPSGWARYGKFLQGVMGDNAQKNELSEKKLSRGWCIGSADFKVRMRQALGDPGAVAERFAGLDSGTIRTEREEFWEDRLRHLARAAKLDLAKLGPRKSSPDKVLLAACLKQTTSVSNGWLAKRLHMGEPASASQFVRRLLLTSEGPAQVDAILAKVRT